MELLSVIVIPAHDEEDQIAGCLHALGAQTVPRAAFEVVLVADDCRDGTAEVAEAVAGNLSLPLTVLPAPGLGAGAARRIGMDAAAARLLEQGNPSGLIACTDADSRPAPDWLERQLAHVDAGAQAIAGVIELDPQEAARLPGGVRRRRAREALSRLERVREHDPDAAHHHFAGASLGVTAAAYLAVGGLEPVSALEDAMFGERLRRHGVQILRAADVVVSTSARSAGRARRGLAVDLAISSWGERRRLRAGHYDVDGLARLKGARTISVIIPVKECAETIVGVIEHTVRPLIDAGLLDEVLVVDAASRDGTAALAERPGVRVVQQDSVLAEHGMAAGKGDAMWRGLYVTTGEIVCFLDGDTGDPDPSHLIGLIGPLISDPSITLVKGSFDRPLMTGDGALLHEGGRVTELMARPLLNLHEPLLSGFSQPLAGEFAARRELLESIPFPVGYGVEIAVMIDALRRCGLDALAECHLGTRQNRHQALRSLSEMAYAVLAAVERRLDGRTSPLGGHYLRPWEDLAVTSVPIAERPPLCELRSSTRPVRPTTLVGD